MAGAGKGNGGGTSFESMSHEQMLAWLDQANAGEVQAAADRLTAAAKEIRKIADELKVRPQWVAWKGDGAEAFRTWADDLANSTHRLGDFSEGAGKWLSHASGAIATAQASTPRDTKSAQANLDAANAAHNDPDAAAVRTKSAGELAALKADREKVRLEAAAQMRKLGQSYDQSATQMNSLERPKFPPPPTSITPVIGQSSEDITRPGSGTAGRADSGSVSSGTARSAGTSRTERRVVEPGIVADLPTSTVPSGHVHPSTIAPAAHVGIDSVTVQPEVHQRSTGPVDVPPTTARPDTQVPLPTNGPVAPLPRGPVRLPSTSAGTGRPVGGGRLPAQPVQGPAGRAVGRGIADVSRTPGRNLPSSTGPVGRAISNQNPTFGRGGTSGSGITGGRPAAPSSTGKPMGRALGPSPGGEPAAGRGSTSRLPNAGVTGQPVTRTSGPTSGRSGATPRDGIVGGTPQRTGGAPARPGAQVPSAQTRGGIAGGVPSEAPARRGVRGATSGATRRAQQRNDKQRNDRRNEPPTTE